MQETPRNGRKSTPEFLQTLFDTLTARGRALLGIKPFHEAGAPTDLSTLGEALLSRRGEASGVALAQSLLSLFDRSSESARLAFLVALADRFGPDPKSVDAAIAAFREEGGKSRLEALHSATEPRRQELFRRLNLAPGGTAALVRMREKLRPLISSHPQLEAVDEDFVHLLSSWFNRGFLVLRRIDWHTPANILEKIIRYEAVHAIRDWDDLRGRLEPQDRRCYAFFHPSLVDEPLIFVEIALTREIPAAIAPLLEKDRKPIAAREATTAVFYSISNTQRGLAGISFGNFLIKQVAEDLARELPDLKTFVTLSPAPGFAAWARKELEEGRITADAGEAVLNRVPAEPQNADRYRERILALGASYFLEAKLPSGKPVDPVARFHLGNGARLERLNFMGDPSVRGMEQSLGLMVNYLYDLRQIEANHEAFAEHGEIAASDAVRALLPGQAPNRTPSAKRGRKSERGKPS